MCDSNVTDCLVLKIEERDQDTYELDNTVFILYDYLKCQYVIRGERRDNSSIKKSCDYSFVCDKKKQLVSFLTTLIPANNLWTYILYNYDNLPKESNDITYEFLKEYESEEYELYGYDDMMYNKKKLLKQLSILKNVYNEFS